MKAKTQKSVSKSKNKSKKRWLSKIDFKSRKIQMISGIIVIALVGGGYTLFAKAQTLNCQKQNGVDICDVNQISGGADTILSIGPEAETLGNSGWGMYFGAAFRAPSSAYNGAVPVHRVINVGATWHDWVIDSQKRDKEAKYGTLAYEGVTFYAWDHQAAGTVPVYRLTMAGDGTKVLFSTDKAWVDKMVAIGSNDPNGWKLGEHMPAIAFYAYPPNYSVPGTSNPGDCSKPENFVKDICKQAATNLDNEIKAGNIPTSNTCPATVEEYKKAPFPGQFSSDCQKKWNDVLRARATTPAPNNPTPQPSSTQPSDQSTSLLPVAPSDLSSPATTVANLPPPTKTDKPVDACPAISPNADEGLKAYINGVNVEHKNYSQDCHTLYLTFARNKNISPCPQAATLDAGLELYIKGVAEKKEYDLNCHRWYLTYANNKAESQKIAGYSDQQLDEQCAKPDQSQDLKNRCVELFYKKVDQIQKARRRQQDGATAIAQSNTKQWVEVGICDIYSNQNYPHGLHQYTLTHFSLGIKSIMSREDCLSLVRAYREDLTHNHRSDNFKVNNIKSALKETKMMDSAEYSSYHSLYVKSGWFSSVEIHKKLKF